MHCHSSLEFQGGDALQAYQPEVSQSYQGYQESYQGYQGYPGETSQSYQAAAFQSYQAYPEGYQAGWDQQLGSRLKLGNKLGSATSVKNCMRTNPQVDPTVENLEIQGKHHLYHPGNTLSSFLGITIYRVYIRPPSFWMALSPPAFLWRFPRHQAQQAQQAPQPPAWPSAG